MRYIETCLVPADDLNNYTWKKATYYTKNKSNRLIVVVENRDGKYPEYYPCYFVLQGAYVDKPPDDDIDDVDFYRLARLPLSCHRDDSSDTSSTSNSNKYCWTLPQMYLGFESFVGLTAVRVRPYENSYKGGSTSSVERVSHQIYMTVYEFSPDNIRQGFFPAQDFTP